MTRNEMIALVRVLFDATESEDEEDRILDSLVDAAPHSMISDLIYYPDRDRTPGEIVDEALRREDEWRVKNAV